MARATKIVTATEERTPKLALSAEDTSRYPRIMG
jgi:hypothetical protein